MQDCVAGLNARAAGQALPVHLSYELRNLLVASTHRVARAREIASKYLNRLITSFPSLMCDPTLVYGILECLTLLRRACENEFTDEVPFMPVIAMEASFDHDDSTTPYTSFIPRGQASPSS